jgi:hypothetical protein
MSIRVKLDVQSLNSHKLTSPDKTTRAPNSWAKHLSQFPKLCKEQISDEELEEARRRGCYKVLPPVLEPNDTVRTVDELLKAIDAEVRQALVL